MREWLAREQAVLDEIRTTGLMTGQSIADINIGRWSFISARLAKSCAEALLMDAHLAAEEGNIPASHAG